MMTALPSMSIHTVPVVSVACIICHSLPVQAAPVAVGHTRYASPATVVQGCADRLSIIIFGTATGFWGRSPPVDDISCQ